MASRHQERLTGLVSTYIAWRRHLDPADFRPKRTGNPLTDSLKIGSSRCNKPKRRHARLLVLGLGRALRSGLLGWESIRTVR
jgi:hypothetical protein